jgi:hypothetical protein
LTIHQLTVDVSDALDELITKLVLAIMDAVGAERTPCVPPGVLTVRKILEEAVTAVVATVMVPAVIAAEVPIEAFDPVAILSLFPAVPKTTFPLVAVMAPDVAVRVVDAVSDPVTAVLPVAFPMLVAPVPPVPIVVTPAPVVFMVVVPVMAAPPADAVIPPVVAVRPVDAVKEPVTAVLPVAFPMRTAPVPPVPIVVTAAPDALMLAVPT